MPGMNVILFGYRGCGKSTVGRLVAGQLGLSFVDVDEQVRQRFGGLPIAQIWQRYGEPAFRAAEAELTEQLCREDGQVIALGGGTLMQPAARRAVEQLQRALRVFLDCQPQELLRRIQADPATAADRPALTRLGGGLEEIMTILEQRRPVYRAVADRILDVTSLSPEQAAEQIVAWYRAVEKMCGH